MTDTEASVQRALTQLGLPYVWGAENPGQSFDCSGLVQWAFKPDFPGIPRVTYAQMVFGTAVEPSQRQRGDLVFPDAGHVTICLGGGMLLEAPQSGETVHIIKDYAPNPVAVRRLGPNSGNPGSGTAGYTDNLGSVQDASVEQTNWVSDLLGGKDFKIIESVFKALTEPSFWIRFIKGLAGLVILGMGSFYLLDSFSSGSVSDSFGTSGKFMKSAAKSTVEATEIG